MLNVVRVACPIGQVLISLRFRGFFITIRYRGFFPSYLLPAPCSLLPAPCSLLPAPCSLKYNNLYLTQLKSTR
ncbi:MULTISPECIES: hypothetical protein [unclassified Moorena]|uniref:hypothetical protein n=1 Tax=unclassified Moorena TaxID=2683338 RepID=UPI0014019D5C|nr:MULTISPECIES: hypothetical protein [unclassified Moorena]NEO16295.1 hypothetical protein [Moorena sp. SIO3E8]NEQ02833.1 hypothetical protein [Moorena sp. SIO3F7]